MAHRHLSFLLAAPSTDAVILGAQVFILGVRGSVRGFHQAVTQPRAAFTRAPGAALTTKSKNTARRRGLRCMSQNRLASKNRVRGLFGKEKFVYEVEGDCYRCPAQERLDFRFETQEGDQKFRYYWTKACPGCALKPQCTTDPRFHRIKRWEHEGVLERIEQRVKVNSVILKLRKQLVEHPFGTLKFWNDQRHFLMKGLEKVKAEFSLSTLAYDIKRALNILGVKGLIAALN